ncbi:MAG TPA: 23S rRNA (adenine(1618)-N(6))-methyltransferase RlmF [Flavobacterium sp.]|nr:23S rRNA (adenine(1618)-N(6))-methyltransferase RlmF [Flavobacterium sp.]
MEKHKTGNGIEKTNLHPRNPHRFGYDFVALTAICPELEAFVFTNKFHTQTIDFNDAKAVKTLNKALLQSFYGIENWDIPDGRLCPPVPGRADYIHYIADVLASKNDGIIPEGESVCGLDIGIGANAIYPIIGNSAYGWSFVGTDVDKRALQNCVEIIEANPKLQDLISLQLQPETRFIFKNIIETDEKFAFTICNPPFHASAEEAAQGNLRKTGNLRNEKASKTVLNFGGKNSELWCEGGEIAFITQMIYESAKYPKQCFWFTTLVSKSDNIKPIEKLLKKVNASEIRIVEMAQGQKTSRFFAWTFLSEEQQKNWQF